MPTYAIGDIHGCNRTFETLLERLPLQDGDALILIGDLIDRGPDSKGVIDTVFRLRRNGHPVTCLRGNHEQLLLNGLLHPDKIELWLFNGGLQTLESFGVKHLLGIPERYLNFFQAMPHWYETQEFLCVHAGLNFTRPNPLDEHYSLLWIRRWYDDIDYNWLGDRIVLHGHTPLELATIQAQRTNLAANRYLNLDNGCVYALRQHDRPDLGRLVAFCLDTRELIWQNCVD
ncbi:MAG: serine/threonine protein phosphatase [Lewinellaceae bacterium]|nr:serine/threonine protein phosphatase [Saprospiraceae bacterium]MCB9333616.1 serine/threonine protein phosphatase [Lewinellaceae bacterium]